LPRARAGPLRVVAPTTATIGDWQYMTISLYISTILPHTTPSAKVLKKRVDPNPITHTGSAGLTRSPIPPIGCTRLGQGAPLHLVCTQLDTARSFTLLPASATRRTVTACNLFTRETSNDCPRVRVNPTLRPHRATTPKGRETIYRRAGLLLGRGA